MCRGFLIEFKTCLVLNCFAIESL